MRRLAQLTTFAFVFFALFASCSTGAGDGRVYGALSLPPCGVESTDFDMDIRFFAADFFENTLTIRLQSTGEDQNFSDGVILVIRDVEKIAGEALDQQCEIKVDPELETFIAEGAAAGIPKTTADSIARATLYLNDTCPSQFLAFTDGVGWIRFEHIYLPGEQKQIKGDFKLDFVDPRHWESQENYGPHAELSGEFNFNYTRGKPAQTFP